MNTAPPSFVPDDNVIQLAPAAPPPPGYVLVQHEAGLAAVRPDPDCTRCRGSTKYRFVDYAKPEGGGAPVRVVRSCRCVNERLRARIAPSQAVAGPAITGAEALVDQVVATAVVVEHDAGARRATTLRAQLAGVEGRLAAAQAELDRELDRIDTSIGEIAREQQRCVEDAARANTTYDAHIASRDAARAAAADLRAQARALLERAADLDRVAAEAHDHAAGEAVTALRRREERERIAARGLAAFAVREKVVRRHVQRTRADRRAAERLREKLDEAVRA